MAELRSSMLKLFSFLFFLLCFVTLRVSSCGISTHIDIGHQAINWFKDTRNNTDYREIILRHQDAFIGGNPYPDAMYSGLCFKGKFHAVAEDTHWAPFINATVRYIRKKYPKPWDQVSGIDRSYPLLELRSCPMLSCPITILHFPLFRTLTWLHWSLNFLYVATAEFTIAVE